MAIPPGATKDLRDMSLSEVQAYLAELTAAETLRNDYQTYLDEKRRIEDTIAEAQRLLEEEEDLKSIRDKINDQRTWSDLWPWNWNDRAARRQLTPDELQLVSTHLSHTTPDPEGLDTDDIDTLLVNTTSDPGHPNQAGDLATLNADLTAKEQDITDKEAEISSNAILAGLNGKDTTPRELARVRHEAQQQQTILSSPTRRAARATRNFNARRRGTGGPTVAPASGSALRKMAAGVVVAGLAYGAYYDYTNGGPFSTTLANLGSHGIDLTTGSVASLGWPSMDWVSFENIDFSSLSEFLSSSASVGGLTVPMLPVLFGGLFALNEFRKGNVVKGFGLLTKSVITGTSLALLASTMYTMPAIASATLLGAATPTIIVAGTMVVAGAGLGYLLGRMIPPFFGKQNFMTSVGYGAVISALTLGFIHADQVANFFSGDSTVSSEPVSGDLTARVETLERELAEARRVIEGKDAEITALKGSETALKGSETALKAQLETETARADAAERELRELRGEREVVREGTDREVVREGVEAGLSAELRAEITALKAQIQGLTGEITALREAGVTIDASVLESLNERIAALEADALTSEETIADLRGDIADYRAENERLRLELEAERAEREYEHGYDHGEGVGFRDGLAIAEGESCNFDTERALRLDSLTTSGSLNPFIAGYGDGVVDGRVEGYEAACGETLSAAEFLTEFKTSAALSDLIDGDPTNDAEAMKTLANIIGDDLSSEARDAINTMTDKHFIDVKYFVEFIESTKGLDGLSPTELKAHVVNEFEKMTTEGKTLDRDGIVDSEWFENMKSRIADAKAAVRTFSR